MNLGSIRTHICQVPKLKLKAALIMSVLVTDLVLLQAIWKLFVLIVNCFLPPTKGELQHCDRCARDLKITERANLGSKVCNGGDRMRVGSSLLALEQ